MRVFHDWEFLEDGSTIAAISVALVREDGTEYYAIFDDPKTIARALKHEWIRDNVLPSLPIHEAAGSWFGWWDRDHPDYQHVKPRDQIRDEVKDFLLATPDLELWGWYSSYDHVCLAQLFGRMIDLPDGVPMWTNDLRSEVLRLGLSEGDLPKQEGGVHNALADARHLVKLAEYLDWAEYGPPEFDDDGEPWPTCRPVDDGEGGTVAVYGSQPMDEEDQAAFKQVIGAAKRRMQAEKEAEEAAIRADERAKVVEEMRSEAVAHRRSMEDTTEIPQREVLMVRALALDTAASWLTQGEA